MPQDIETTIRERAYQLWVADGCRDESEQHWLTAEREVLAAFAATAPAPKGRSRAANSNVDAAAKAPTKAPAKPAAKARRRA